MYNEDTRRLAMTLIHHATRAHTDAPPLSTDSIDASCFYYAFRALLRQGINPKAESSASDSIVTVYDGNKYDHPHQDEEKNLYSMWRNAHQVPEVTLAINDYQLPELPVISHHTMYDAIINLSSLCCTAMFSPEQDHGKELRAELVEAFSDVHRNNVRLILDATDGRIHITAIDATTRSLLWRGHTEIEDWQSKLTVKEVTSLMQCVLIDVFKDAKIDYSFAN